MYLLDRLLARILVGGLHSRGFRHRQQQLASLRDQCGFLFLRQASQLPAAILPRGDGASPIR